MKHEEVPSTFPFKAYTDDVDYNVAEWVVLSYGFAPGAEIKTFVARAPDGVVYQTAIDGFRLTREEVEEEIRGYIREELVSLYDHEAYIKNRVADLKNHPLYEETQHDV